MEDFPVLCTSIGDVPSSVTALFSSSNTAFTLFYPLPKGDEYVGLYDVLSTVADDASGCDQPYTSAFSPSLDSVRLVSQIAVLSKPTDSDQGGSPPSPSLLKTNAMVEVRTEG